MKSMMELARPYAKAIFELAQSSQNPNEALVQWQQFNRALSSLIEAPEVLPLLNHPQVSKKLLEEVLLKVFGKDYPIFQQNFLKLLISHQHLPLIKIILELLNQKIAEKKAVTQALFESPFEVAPSVMRAVQESLEKKFQTPFELTQALNPDLIGGYKIKTNHWVLDCSIQTELKNLERNLKAGM